VTALFRRSFWPGQPAPGDMLVLTSLTLPFLSFTFINHTIYQSIMGLYQHNIQTVIGHPIGSPFHDGY
jgi:hypothetical protein